MDGFREVPAEFELSSATAVETPQDVAAEIGTDERRLHVRAYNYWVSLLDGRDFPSIEDLEPADLEDFSSHSILLDFTCGGENPAIPYVGAAIRDECGLSDDMRTIADVPSRSLLSRLTDHYMQIIANRAPVGFEAEFENPTGETLCYRGILMPFSSDSETIDFIYGVINWKHVDGGAVEVEPRLSNIAEAPLDDGVEPLELTEALPATFDRVNGDSFESIAPEASFDTPDDDAIDLTAPGDGASLADWLCAARETADAVKAGEGRTRAALYRALSLAYDFALAARDNPEDYAELLQDSGVKAQTRAPMTPIVKLVFGVDYDKARLTEFAAALSFAQRQCVTHGEFEGFIQAQAGGLKGLVAAERLARRPAPRPDTRGEAAREKLRAARAISLEEIASADEFAVVVTRRTAAGVYEPIAVVDDEALVERVIRRAA